MSHPPFRVNFFPMPHTLFLKLIQEGFHWRPPLELFRTLQCVGVVYHHWIAGYSPCIVDGRKNGLRSCPCSCHTIDSSFFALRQPARRVLGRKVGWWVIVVSGRLDHKGIAAKCCFCGCWSCGNGCHRGERDDGFHKFQHGHTHTTPSSLSLHAYPFLFSPEQGSILPFLLTRIEPVDSPRYRESIREYFS